MVNRWVLVKDVSLSVLSAVSKRMIAGMRT